MKAYDLNYQNLSHRQLFTAPSQPQNVFFLRSTNVGIFCKKKKSLLIFALFLVFFNFLLAFSVVMKKNTRSACFPYR